MENNKFYKFNNDKLDQDCDELIKIKQNITEIEENIAKNKKQY